MTLFFNQYQQNYSQSAWNTSEIGGAISDFTNSIGPKMHLWYIPPLGGYPLSGNQCWFSKQGFCNLAKSVQDIQTAVGSKLFMVKIDDLDALVTLQHAQMESYSVILQRISNKIIKYYVFNTKSKR